MIANAAFVARAAFAIIFPRDQRVKWVSGSRPAGLWIRRCAGGTTTSLELDADEAGALDDRLPASGLEADEMIELGHAHGLGDEAVALQPRVYGRLREARDDRLVDFLGDVAGKLRGRRDREPRGGDEIGETELLERRQVGVVGQAPVGGGGERAQRAAAHVARGR